MTIQVGTLTKTCRSEMRPRLPIHPSIPQPSCNREERHLGWHRGQTQGGHDIWWQR